MPSSGKPEELFIRIWSTSSNSEHKSPADVDYNGQDFWNSSQGAATSPTRSYFGLKIPLTAAEREAFAPQCVTVCDVESWQIAADLCAVSWPWEGKGAER
jgi:hypothetical protein